MAYFSKQILLKAYQTICSIHRDPKTQGATQTISALKYFFALEMFYKKFNRPCNTSDRNDKKDFCSFVGYFVDVNPEYFTSDFYIPLKSKTESPDYNVGSNFFSVNSVKNSRSNGGKIITFPTRGNKPLINIKDGSLIEDKTLFENVTAYLNDSNEILSAVSIWLARNGELDNSNIFQSTKAILLNMLPVELVSIILPNQNDFDDFIGDVSSATVDSIAILEPSDICSLFGPVSKVKALSLGDTNYQTRNFLPAIRTKPFLLLAGISGTGKSQIVKEMAFATCPNVDDLRSNQASPGNYCLVEVKPNWHDSTELLGYDSAIKKRYVVTKFIKFVVKAMRYPDVPFFVCLDEMNLAPVEQYFAEFLSVLESRKLVNGEIISEPLINREAFQNDLVAKELFNLQLPSVGDMQVKAVQLSDADLGENANTWHTLQEKGLCLPQNLIVIGTVNMDETTHQFSRKVIDRAMTFEMNEADFDSYFEDKVTLDYVEEPLSAALFLARNVNGNRAIEDIDNLKEQFKTNVVAMLKALNATLEDTPFKIAYRVQNELVLYFTELLRENPEADQEQLLTTALDDIMMMKVLPRIEGDDELLGTRNDGTLKLLAEFAANLPKSAKKIEEMTKRLERSHFTSFWP